MSVAAVAHPPCPLCGCGTHTPVFDGLNKKGQSLRIARCGDCGLMRQEPMRTPEGAFEHYSNCPSAAGVDPGRAAFIALDLLRFESELSGRRLLDVGCGNGDLLRVARDHGWSCVGVEPNTNLCQALRSRWDLEVHPGSLPNPRLAGREFDLVVMSFVRWRILSR